jgi:hypothetical protein
MRQNGYLRLFLLVILVLTVSALPGFSQAAQGRTPAPKTPAEFTAYTAAYNEKDPAKKAELAEKFITEFKDSELLSGAYSMVISGSMNSKNWAKAMESADKVSALSGVDDKTKKFAYENALMAANNENNIDKVLSYGDKVLAMDPNNLNTLRCQRRFQSSIQPTRINSTLPRIWPPRRLRDSNRSLPKRVENKRNRSL